MELKQSYEREQAALERERAANIREEAAKFREEFLQQRVVSPMQDICKILYSVVSPRSTRNWGELGGLRLGGNR